MMIKIVTDSSSDIPPEIARELDITVVPLSVRFGAQTYRDGIDIMPEEFYRRLVDEPVHPATAAASPGDFAGVYTKLAAEAGGIISIHLSQKVSATYSAAVQGRSLMENKACPVEVIDSRFVTIALGLITIAAARAAQAGKDMQEIVAQVNALVPCMRVYGILDTLKYVMKGGRLGRAGPFISSILPVKPVLTMKDGTVTPIGAARTRIKAIERLCGLIAAVPMVQQLGIAHSASEEELLSLVEKIKSILPDVKPVISKLGPALGVHGGPGSILVGIQQDIKAAAAAIQSRERKITFSLPSLQSIKDGLRQRGKEEAGHSFVLRCNGMR
jgi:DegV family protein with EDD domain